MIKKLDKLVLKAFLGPFFATFFIAFFVLLLQTLWKYIDDLVGKGLDFVTVMQFLWYASSGLLTLALPIAILISSIMTFGNLGENFQLVAIRSSGISLLRFMRPLIFISIILCGITFVFGNYVIPYANLKFVTLYNDIFYKKPAFDLKEGVFFTHIPNYAIKVGKKDADGNTIRNILIYEQGGSPQDVCITAEKGHMKITPDKRFLEFNLENGYRYQERGNVMDTSTEYIRLKFQQFKKLFDLSSLQKGNTPDSVFKNSFKMLSAHQLTKRIDSMQTLKDSFKRKGILEIDKYFHYSEKLAKEQPLSGPLPAWNIPDSLKDQIDAKLLNTLNQIRSNLQFSEYETQSKSDEILYSNIEWHRKFSLSLACLILFFIGAPLGSIIRKGGFGMPLVVAIILFLIFHLFNVFGEKFVKEHVLSPFVGMWLSVLVLTPVCILFTYKAMNDSQLFSKEFYSRLFRPFKRIFRSTK